MEEKKEIKIRLSTVICLFIIVVLIIALGIMYYFGFVNKVQEPKEDIWEDVTNSNENVESDEDVEINTENNEETNESNKSEENIWENVTDSNEDIENEVETNKTETSKKNTEDTKEIKNKCKKIFEKYLDIEGYFNSGYSLTALNKLGLISEVPDSEKYDAVRNDYGDYYKTDIKYEKFKSAMLNYVTEEYYKKNIEKTYAINANGYLQITADGGTATYFNIEKIELSSKDKKSYTFNIKGKASADDVGAMGTETIKVKFEKKNNNYVISDISR